MFEKTITEDGFPKSLTIIAHAIVYNTYMKKKEEKKLKSNL